MNSGAWLPSSSRSAPGHLGLRFPALVEPAAGNRTRPRSHPNRRGIRPVTRWKSHAILRADVDRPGLAPGPTVGPGRHHESRLWSRRGDTKRYIRGMTSLLHATAERATRYLTSLDQRPVAPSADALARLASLDTTLPDGTTPPKTVIAELDEIGSPATLASAGARYFGFVIGGALPVTVAANWLAAAWDQNAGLVVASPVDARLEETRCAGCRTPAPADPAGGGFVTCATTANFTGLAAARHALLRRQGWDVEARGLFGAPGLQVVVSAEIHASVQKALAMLGLGRDRVVRVPVDEEGRMRIEALPPLDWPDDRVPAGRQREYGLV